MSVQFALLTISTGLLVFGMYISLVHGILKTEISIDE
jgi:hypothetical protein